MPVKLQEEVLQDWHSLCQKICKLVKLQRKPYPGPWDKIGACQGDLRICCILVPGLQRYLLPLVPRLHCYGDGIDANDGLVGTEWQFCSGTCIADSSHYRHYRRSILFTLYGSFLRAYKMR